MGEVHKGDAPNFLSTHPSMEERMKIAEEKIQASGITTTAVPEGLELIWLEIQQQ